jgi:hypothetical protein
VSDFYPPMSSEPALREHLVQFVGGAAAVTKVFGRGITVTYVSTGLVDLKWSTTDDAPGTFVGPKCLQLHATTASGVKGFSVATGVYNASTRTLRVAIWDASNNLVDLAALQWLTATILFLVDRIGP